MTEDDGLDGGERRQERAHDVGASGDCRHGRRRLPAERLQRIDARVDDVVPDDAMPRGDEPRRHRVAEQAEADDADY
jgi:hypothetical protein